MGDVWAFPLGVRGEMGPAARSRTEAVGRGKHLLIFVFFLSVSLIDTSAHQCDYQKHSPWMGAA